MKRRISCALLALVFTFLLGGTALASNTDNDYGTIKNPVTEATVEFDSSNPEIIKVTYTGLTAGEQCLVLMVVKDADGKYNINENTILYIDQGTVGSDGSITFSVYPSAIRDSVILICGAKADGSAGPVQAAIVEGKFVLGDVNASGAIDVADAMLILQHITEANRLDSTQLQSADVNRVDGVNIADAMLILQLITGAISSFN